MGPSITIRGDVSGDEDLLIQGRVEGSVDLKLKSVTVGTEGRVKANITGRVVIVEGEVEGDLKAKEQVVLRSTARVQGDITAARVVLEDGASFRGGVDMGDPSGQGKQTAGSPAAQEKTAPEPTKALSESVKALPGTGKDAPGTTTDKATP
ncbi:MAG: polymer-forming cytoskeletal protein [Gemmatimonadota bacterium]